MFNNMLEIAENVGTIDASSRCSKAALSFLLATTTMLCLERDVEEIVGQLFPGDGW